MNISKFNALVAQSHEAARASGWWSDLETGEPIVRNKGELLALVHTELAEADEAEAASVMDDKLPHRWGEEVELADAVIRLGDYAGGFGYDVTLEEEPGSATVPIGPGDYYCYLHRMCARITEHERKGRHEKAEWSLRRVLEGIVAVATNKEYDLVGAIEEKLVFNVQRADHKVENRAADGGKKF